MSVLGMYWINIAVIIRYFMVVVYIGSRVMKKVKMQEDCSFSGRQFTRFS
jgi:Na+/proline symporter